MPTQSSGNVGFNPLANRSRASKQENVDADGWGTDAPQVTRTQLEKVQPAYQRTVVDMGHLGSGRDDSRQADFSRDGSGNPDVVKGAYQPVGKVDIAALRRQAQDTEKSQDDRPTAVKGAYEPVGKVDIAAIRARAQQPAPESSISPEPTGASADSSQEPRGGVAERSAAFNAPERLTTLPKPKVANRFGGGSGTFAGTKAPTPGGFGLESKKSPSAAPIGASRNFADQSGKTPAQLWAEKKAQQGGAPVAPGSGGLTSPQSGGAAKSGGEWKSGYTGKSWAPVQPTKASKSMPTGESQTSEPAEREAPADAAPEPPVSGGVGAMRDRFKDAPPMGAQAPGTAPRPPSPPPLETSTKPNAGRGVPIPGIAQPPPAAAAPEPDEDADADAGSPIQVAMPVSRAAPEPGDEALAARSPPPAPVPQPVDAPAARNKTPPPRSPSPPTAAAGAGEGARALAQYDYAKAEDNELELREGELVTHIEMVDPDWWMGTNARGEQGLFPSNYVEVVPDEDDAGAAGAGAGVSPLAVASEPPAAPSAGAAAATASAGATATAQYDYEAAEDNELSFPEGAKITHVVRISCSLCSFPNPSWHHHARFRRNGRREHAILIGSLRSPWLTCIQEFPDDDWWSGEYGGRAGLFPANYVELNE